MNEESIASADVKKSRDTLNLGLPLIRWKVAAVSPLEHLAREEALKVEPNHQLFSLPWINDVRTGRELTMLRMHSWR